MNGSGTDCVTADTCLPRLCATRDGSGRVTALSFWNDANALVPVPACGSGSGSGSGSGGGPVTTPCCPNGWPETLTLTFGTGTGDMACLNGQSYTLTWNGSLWLSATDLDLCGVYPDGWQLVCTGTSFVLGSATIFAATAVSQNCSTHTTTWVVTGSGFTGSIPATVQ